MTTRIEYGVRVDWGDGREDFVPETAATPEEAQHWADTWPYPTANAIVIQRDVEVGEWRETRRDA